MFVNHHAKVPQHVFLDVFDFVREALCLVAPCGGGGCGRVGVTALRVVQIVAGGGGVHVGGGGGGGRGRVAIVLAAERG